LARPGGNLTGFTNFEPQIGSKWLEVLKELSPRLDEIAAIYNPEAAPYAPTYLSSIQRAAPSFGVKTAFRGIENVGAIESAIASIGNGGAVGLIILPDAFTASNRAPIIAAAKRHSVPAIYPYSVFVQSGGLASYGPDPADQYRQVATYIDRILKGANPADLPVQAPTKFELVINLKAAKTLKLTVPLTLQAAADEVIE
jgi:putative ABC transport system substrate-binding protein